MDSKGYKVGGTKIGTEQLQSQDGKNRNVSTIEIEILKGQDSSNADAKKLVPTTKAGRERRRIKL